ncbi:MAG: CoA transferase [Dehalococcoidia bacterium]|nr:CoA transferase [Dehalococcoidia bacterium]
MGPLKGIRVLDVGMYYQGPAAGYMLGDLGADVIKIEPPVTGDRQRGVSSMYGALMTTPDGRSVAFEAGNRSKRSMTLDLQNAAGKDVLHKLVSKSDVFITNFSNRVIKELNLEYETLSRYNPKLIYGATSAFGGKGPLADRVGYDPVGQAFSGAMWMFGDRDDPEPSMVVGSIFDQLAATLLVYGVLAALVARNSQGVGQKVETSLVGGGIHLQAYDINTFFFRGRGMQRFSRKRCRNPLTNYYKCADGKWIMLSEPRGGVHWQAFCKAIGIPGLENNEQFNTFDARRKNYAEFIALLDQTFATKTRDEWINIFSNYDFGYSPVYDRSDLTNEPQLLANEYVVEMQHPAWGKVKTVGFPVQFSRTPAAIRSAAPEFGQHTEEILSEVLGYSWDEIGSLREKGAFG